MLFKIFGFRGIYFDFLSFFGISLHILLLFCNFKLKLPELISTWLTHYFRSLRRYDTIKTSRWNFPELFIIGKYVKIEFKNKGSSCYFLSSRGQKIKNITKIEQKRLFLFIFLFPFFMAFLAQKLIYTINIWFNFVFSSFFEQDHLFNLFVLRVYAKR